MTARKKQREPDSNPEDSILKFLQNMYEAILITDTGGRIAEANVRAAQLLMLQREELISRSLGQVISGFDETILKNIAQSLKKQPHMVLQLRCMRSDGTTFPAEIAVHKVNLGRDLQLCFSIRDVTQWREDHRRLQEAQEELIKTEKIKARMETVTTLAHEINNPLQILLSMIESDKNTRYVAPLNRIISVMQQLRLNEELKTVSYAGAGHRYAIPAPGIMPSVRKRLLVVDDEPALRNFFQTVLSATFPDLEIETSGNGYDAVEKFRVYHHATVILDISMPDMDGEETFLEISRTCEEGNWEMPSVIFCTGYTPPEYIREVLDEQSLHCCLRKPIPSDLIIDTVRNRLEFYDLCHSDRE